MTTASTVEMSADEVDAFLGRRGTGVLSLARDGVSYAIPVSYGYDAAARSVYFRLGHAPDSEKRAFADATERATFVVYAERDGVWRSVVARGRLEAVADEDLDAALVRALRQMDLPLLSHFERPDELEFEIRRLVVDDLSGRRSVPDDRDG
ncbi:MAG: pyridoxamine 5'-phosphate oxidase family protein [Salinigranum sp.]